MASDPHTEQLVHKLVRTLGTLMKEKPGAWFNWSQVARAQEGSSEFADLLSGLALLDGYRDLFAMSTQKVKLSEKGLHLYFQEARGSASETEKIAEIVRRYAGSLRPIRLDVIGVAKITRSGNKFVQALHVGVSDEIVPTETPVRVRPKSGRGTSGKIVGQEKDGGTIYAALDQEVLPVDLPATLEIDRGYLLRNLAEHLGAMERLPKLIEVLFKQSGGALLPIADEDSIRVVKGLLELDRPWARLLWGPPGAGKTYALGWLIAELAARETGDKILLVAASNRAVDVAAENVLRHLEMRGSGDLIATRKLLRYGYPRKPEILARPEVLGPEHLDELNRRVERISKQIAAAERERVDDAEVAVLRAELLAAQEDVKAAVSEHIGRSLIVATTATLAFSSDLIYKRKWSTVVVDEVTMATPALCAFLSSLVVDRLLLAGDPLQLGPVFEGSSQTSEESWNWLGMDVFEKCGVSVSRGGRREIAATDARLARITSQRRCASEIWSRVAFQYSGIANRVDDNERNDLFALPPHPGRAVVVLDTKGQSECEKVHGSWRNEYQASLSLEVACTVASEASKPVSIAIISPYRAQVQLLRKWIRVEQHADITPYSGITLEAGTVHQFQGSDADVVIFDVTDGPGRKGPGKLLSGEAGERLVNVAVTRAKGKLVVVADKTWCERHLNPSDHPLLWRLVVGSGAADVVAVQPPPRLSGKRGSPEPESPIEEALYRALLERSDLPTFELQHEIADESGRIVTRADFAFPVLKYAVYCDGMRWHLPKDRWQRDLRQRNKLVELGWVFSVFSGRDINVDAAKCVEQIANTCLERARVLARLAKAPAGKPA